MSRALKYWTDGFVVWVIAFSAVAYFAPSAFTPLRPLINPGLGVIMFGMGMTLTGTDFARVLTRKRAVACGVLGQFVAMPLLAFLIGIVFRMAPEMAMGFIILGSCPGGTASNVIAYLAKADVALSVTMTACSTILGVFLTPLLIRWLGGEYLPVDAWALLWSVVQIVLIPVAAGISIRWWLGDRAQRMAAVFPAISVLVIAVIVAIIVALSRDKLGEVIGLVGFAVVLHNLAGLTMGYGFGALFRLPEDARRTVAIEVGMQNSGLGVALATTHFTNAIVALPSSLFSIVHNVTGSALASVWARIRVMDNEKSSYHRDAESTERDKGV